MIRTKIIKKHFKIIVKINAQEYGVQIYLYLRETDRIISLMEDWWISKSFKVYVMWCKIIPFYLINGKVNVTYETCTDIPDPDGRFWCSTKVDENGVHQSGNWGHCDQGDAQGDCPLPLWNCLALFYISFWKIGCYLGMDKNPNFFKTRVSGLTRVLKWKTRVFRVNSFYLTTFKTHHCTIVDIPFYAL